MAGFPFIITYHARRSGPAVLEVRLYGDHGIGTRTLDEDPAALRGREAWMHADRETKRRWVKQHAEQS